MNSLSAMHEVWAAIAASPGCCRLLAVSVEVAVLAVAVWCLIRVLRIRSARVCSLLWILVLAKGLFGLAFGAPLEVAALRLTESARPSQSATAAISAEDLARQEADMQRALREAESSAGASVASAPNGTDGRQPSSPVIGAQQPRRSMPSRLSGVLASLSRFSLVAHAAGLLTAVWLAGVLWALLATALDLRRIRDLARASGAPSPELLAVFRTEAARLGIARVPALSVCAEVESPALAGFLRPTVLAPAWLAETTDADQLRWMLAHELMHYKQKDTVGLLVRRAAQVALWFHPAVWWAGRQWEEAMERACDRALIAGEADARHYAEQLHGVLKSLMARRSRTRVVTGLFATRTQIGKRIAALLTDSLAMPACLSPSSATLVALFAAVALSFGVGVHRPAVAQEPGATAPFSLQFRWVATDAQRAEAEQVPWDSLLAQRDHGPDLWLLKEVLLTQDDLAAAEMLEQPSSLMARYPALLQLNAAATKRFADLTEKGLKQRMAVVLNGKVLSAPVVQSKIPNGQMMVPFLDRKDADAFVAALRAANSEVTASARNEPTFGPVTELLVRHSGEDCLLDFDTGRLMAGPTGMKSTEESFKWVADHGVDVGGRATSPSRGLTGMDMIVDPMRNEEWDSTDPRALPNSDLFRVGKAGNPVYLSAADGLPATYAFKTREGGVGIVQILGFQDVEPRGTKIRYKMVLRHDTQGTVAGPSKPAAPSVNGAVGSLPTKSSLYVAVRRNGSRVGLERIFLRMGKDGEERQVPLDSLGREVAKAKASFPDLRVVIQPSADSASATVVGVLEEMRKGGVEDIGIDVVPEKSGGPTVPAANRAAPAVPEPVGIEATKAAPPELVTTAFHIYGNDAAGVKAKIDAVAQTLPAPAGIGRSISLTGNNLVIRDTPENMSRLAQTLREYKSDRAPSSAFQTQAFDLTPVVSLLGPSGGPANFFESTREVIETFLYADSGKEKAEVEGRAMVADADKFQITVTDTPARLRRVSDYLSSLQQIEHPWRQEVIDIKHVPPDTMIESLRSQIPPAVAARVALALAPPDPESTIHGDRIEIVVRYKDRNDLAAIGDLVDRLDMTPAASQRVTRVQADLDWLATAMESYRAANGVYPATLAGLTSPTAYLVSLPFDYCLSNGIPVEYRLNLDTPDRHPVVYSVGLDGVDQKGLQEYDPVKGEESLGDIVKRLQHAKPGTATAVVPAK